METLQLASRDYNNSSKYRGNSSPEKDESVKSDHPEKEHEMGGPDELTPQLIEDNESKIKDRIAQCRNIIESLKVELNNEKSKLEKETNMSIVPSASDCKKSCAKIQSYEDNNCLSSIYSPCVDSKLNCDQSLIEYEKQLQKYQNTLNRAQVEKKNAIRKQMLAKAYRLKLLEVENQCNIELLRVKQSLQCLEPLKMIANKWKTSNNDSSCDFNTYELLPRFPELKSNSSADVNSDLKDCNAAELSGIGNQEDSSSEC